MVHQENLRSNSPGRVQYHVALSGRDQLRLELAVDAQGLIQHAHLQAIGCPELLRLVKQWRPQWQGLVQNLALPQGNGHAALLMRELILRAQSRWQLPCQDHELCHCRAVSTHDVDQAIIAGAHTSKDVSRETSASTGCGTCRPVVESLIRYRLQSTEKKS